MFGVKEGHTIFCDKECSVTHHEVLVALMLCKRNDSKTFEHFKQCVEKMVALGWDKNSDIPDKEKHFRFPLVHWAAVYGKLAVLNWLADEGFDVGATNSTGETALHRLIACQAHERAVDPRSGRTSGRRYSLGNIVQIFAKVLDILTDKYPYMLLRYEYVERNTPLQFCLKLLNEEPVQKLKLYYESLFKVLCDRLVSLVKQGKLSEEFVRNGLSVKDSSGNTLWHIAANAESSKVIDCISCLMNAVHDLDFSMQNKNGETPAMKAVKSSCPRLASLFEAYKSPIVLLPVVKMEMLSDSEKEECCCEQKVTDDHTDNMSFTLQDAFDGSDLSCKESSPASELNSRLQTPLIPEEQSFTEPPRKLVVPDQQKVILTAAMDVFCNHTNDTEKGLMCSLLPDSEMQVDSDKICNTEGKDKMLDERVVIEKQIDLCISDDSILTSSSQDMGCITNLQQKEQENEARMVESISEDTSVLPDGASECAKKNDPCSNQNSSQTLNSENMAHNIQLPSPPDSENHTSTYQVESILDIGAPVTPYSADVGHCKGISVTPVLLIKLLSEPDVSEKFQSLLKDVITGDTEKVDSAQTTLEQLKSSEKRLESDITKREESLVAIVRRKALLNEEIKKMQEEVDSLENSEETTRQKIVELKHEQDAVHDKIEECESTCKKLKRRLSDCTGALNGLSPKSQKTC